MIPYKEPWQPLPKIIAPKQPSADFWKPNRKVPHYADWTKINFEGYSCYLDPETEKNTNKPGVYKTKIIPYLTFEDEKYPPPLSAKKKHFLSLEEFEKEAYRH